jgi:HlyD family secretion protein
MELGDPLDLEVAVDVLSTDAVKIKPGAGIKLDHWGGEGSLEGKVRLHQDLRARGSKNNASGSDAP